MKKVSRFALLGALSTGLFAASSQAALVINEFDPNTPGTDAAEFVELYNPDPTPITLTNYSVVFFNGSNDQSYASFALTGTLAPGAYLILGNAAVTGVDITFAGNLLQNGQDAIAVYSSGSFPNGTAPTSANLVDAVLYEGADTGLTTALGVQNLGADSDTLSYQRSPNGTGSFIQAAPTPDATNAVPEPTSLTLLGLGGLALLRRKRA